VLRRTHGLEREAKYIHYPYSPYTIQKGVVEVEKRVDKTSKINLNQTTKEWLEEKIKEFAELKPETRLKLLFSR
jgi:hypothetical protein